MIGFRAKLLLFLSLIILVVIVTWIYVQQTYSAFNVVDPGDSENPNGQDPGEGLVIPTLSPTPSQTPTLMPTSIATIQANAGCALPFEYWVQNQANIPPQILVRVLIGNQTEACVNYAQSEICANLGAASISPDVLLRQQFLTAIMNYLSGADAGAIGDVINTAYEWLRVHLPGEAISEGDLQTAQLYADTLRSYNQGEIGPGACEVTVVPIVQPDTATPSLPASGPTSIIPPTSTITIMPTARRTVIITVPVPTDTPDEGPEPTQPPPPTNTASVPSDTPPPPPTSTPPPPPTDIPTPTPVPEDDTPTPVP